MEHITALFALCVVALAMCLAIFVKSGNGAPLYLKLTFVLVGVIIACVVVRVFF